VGRSISASGEEAFTWTNGGGMFGLGDLDGGTHISNATGVSDNGSTVAGYGRSASGTEAIIWTNAGGMVGLGDLDGGPFYSVANAISGDATTIVGTSVSGLGVEAFIWTSGLGMQPIGALDAGSYHSDAYAVSGDGSAVVGTSQLAFFDEAFVWTSTDGMQSVFDLATNQGITGMAGWALRHAYGISADGSNIVGDGENPDGDTEAWMITLPDTDADGRPDYIDNCPNDPNGPLNNPGGGTPQQDDDGDGIGNACDLLLITTPFLPSGRAGKSYSKQLEAVGGEPPYTWELIQGNITFDLSVSLSGLISGDVQSTFLSFFTIQVTDNNGDTATKAFSIAVTLPNCVNCHTMTPAKEF